METPLPYDSLKASLSPPVGGRLRFFRRDWLANKCSYIVLNIITNGCVIPLISKPNLVRAPLIRLQGPSKRPSSGLLYQRWRPVIDLSRFNTFLPVKRFKIKTPESIRASLIPGEWVSSIDLSDAYLHIPIHPNSRKYLRFCHKSQVFQFTSLRASHGPTGLYNDCKRSGAHGPDKGNQTSQYLDDWLIRAQFQEEAQVNSRTVVDLTQSLGWIINQEKS